ncbi:hypothetical protein LINPERPRIM_LOCUS14879, partial [Linum perenne]
SSLPFSVPVHSSAGVDSVNGNNSNSCFGAPKANRFNELNPNPISIINFPTRPFHSLFLFSPNGKAAPLFQGFEDSRYYFSSPAAGVTLHPFCRFSWLLEVVSELEPWGADSVCGVVSAVMSVLDLRQMFLCFLETCFQLSFAQVFRAQLS